jgi:hypothetical protein
MFIKGNPCFEFFQPVGCYTSTLTVNKPQAAVNEVVEVTLDVTGVDPTCPACQEIDEACRFYECCLAKVAEVDDSGNVNPSCCEDFDACSTCALLERKPAAGTSLKTKPGSKTAPPSSSRNSTSTQKRGGWDRHSPNPRAPQQPREQAFPPFFFLQARLTIVGNARWINPSGPDTQQKTLPAKQVDPGVWVDTTFVGPTNDDGSVTANLRVEGRGPITVLVDYISFEEVVPVVLRSQVQPSSTPKATAAMATPCPSSN